MSGFPRCMLTAMATRSVWRVGWDRRRSMWKVTGPRRHAEWWRRKVDAVAAARLMALGSQPAQVVVAGKAGRIQTEWTYPRSSDPRRYVG